MTMKKLLLATIAAATVLVSVNANAATEQEQQVCYRQIVLARASNDIVSSLLATQVTQKILLSSPAAVMQDRSFTHC
jgi:hypothetical protein